jgi:capsular polysaccharide biosynthesis protein
MSEQTVDLRSSLSILRRHRRVLAAAAVLGAAAGVVFVLLRPPMYTSSSLVLLPTAQDARGQALSRDPETEIRIAESEVVLRPAGASLVPRMPVRDLSKRVVVTAPSNDVLQIDGQARTPERAEAISAAVAKSEVGFVTGASASQRSAEQAAIAARQRELRLTLRSVRSEIAEANTRIAQLNPTSDGAQAEATALANLTAERANLVLQIDYLEEQASRIAPRGRATIIQSASPGERPELVAWFVICALTGAVAAVALTSVLLASFGRRDRRLRLRDEIADAVGSPVVASLPSRKPRTAAGWIALLENYSPGTVDAWALRQALRHLVLFEAAARPRPVDLAGGKLMHPRSITMLTLSDDLKALAMGPQIASYAASIGIRTRLVPAQGHETTAPLWAACAGLLPDDEVRRGLVVGSPRDDERDIDLTLVLAVLDRSQPQLSDLPRTSKTVLAVSCGSSTADDLARAAVTADDAGSRIVGVVVADPDTIDRTTGRLLQPERSQQVPLPTRLTGVTGVKAGTPAAPGARRRPR